MDIDLQPLIDFIQTFPQWFQMMVTLLIIVGGGLTLLIKTMAAALNAGLLDIIQTKKKRGK